MSNLIVIFGILLLNFYLNSEFEFTNIIFGLIGFFIIYPSVQKWKTFFLEFPNLLSLLVNYLNIKKDKGK